MEKKYKIFLGVAVGVIVLIMGGIFFLASRSKPATENPPQGNATTTANQNLPQYTLSADEEKQLAEFVKTFASLYNTYSVNASTSDLSDFSNLTALGDYQTVNMQDKTAQLVDWLQNSLPDGFSKASVADASTFRYEYLSASQIYATIDVNVKETDREDYAASALLELQRFGQRWYVNDIQYKEK